MTLPDLVKPNDTIVHEGSLYHYFVDTFDKNLALRFARTIRHQSTRVIKNRVVIVHHLNTWRLYLNRVYSPVLSTKATRFGSTL